MNINSLLVGAILFTSSSFVQAHMLWLERSDNNVQAYFGEFADNKIETQDGPLAKFADATLVQNNTTLTSTAQSDHFSFKTNSKADARLSANLIHGDTLVQFLAKNGRTDTTTAAALEVIPATANSNNLIIHYQGKPLAKQEIVVFAPNRWRKIYHSNEKGEFSIETPWAGQYIIEVGKSIDEAGEYNEEAYKTRYLVATLSFNVQQ